MSLENRSSYPLGRNQALDRPAGRQPEPPRVRTRVRIPLTTADGTPAPSEVITFDGLDDGREHLMVVFGAALTQPVPLVRLHSECLTGDVLGSTRCDCGPQLREAMTLLHEKGGLLLYLRQEGRDIGLYNKIDAYALQDTGMDTFEANRALNFLDDQRTYSAAAQMLLAIGLEEIEILSNNPEKTRQLEAAGITVHSQRRTAVHVTEANRTYLRAKALHAGHSLDIDRAADAD
ncbi:GTP cyclohydrolase [Streptomyces sp. CB02959]|uniref:GTP cyclohydrolase II n=1 Tax=Streptomyces sp. CB02959 TaxID=2020330 RepID=UPI000C26F523|nr:GTP cyclohydrolase II [Streptomyces sp. CB02959]PJN33473.1 GTP cyclohydrolase [Streptomyces sp. CB02959]